MSQPLHADQAERKEHAQDHDQGENVYPGKVLKDKKFGLTRQQVIQGLGHGKADNDKDMQAGDPECLPSAGGKAPCATAFSPAVAAGRPTVFIQYQLLKPAAALTHGCQLKSPQTSN